MTGLPAQHRSPLGRATLGDQLRRHGRTQRDKLAFITYSPQGERATCSYGQLDALANRFAHVCLARGVGRGDRVAVLARNGLDVVVAYYGALKAGAVFTGVNVLHGAAEVLQQLQHAEPRLLVVGAEFAGLVAELGEQLPAGLAVLVIGPAVDGVGESFDAALDAAPDTEPDVELDEHDVALLVYTSGTEAEPKGVLISHRNYLISTAPAWSWGLGTGPDDTWLFVMPFHTIAGIGSMTTLTMMGATLVLPATTDPAASLSVIGREGVTVLAQTPTFYLALAGHPDFGPSSVGTVRRCLTYGGQVTPHVVSAWAQATGGAVWGTYWGQSELSQLGSVGWFTTLDDVPDGDPTWIGTPVSHLEVQVVDPSGAPAEIGELLCRSPSVMLGYFKDPERTAETLRDGWVHTGDIVRIDERGNLFFYDRRKDVIKSGGMNVSSQEVERVLHQQPGVLRAAVVGVPDPYWTEAVTAFVIPAPGAELDPAQLVSACRAQLAGYKAPKAVHLVESLPTDAQGKVLKRELRASVPAPAQA